MIAMETLCLLFYLLLTSSIVAASPVLSQTRDLKIMPKVFIIDAVGLLMHALCRNVVSN